MKIPFVDLSLSNTQKTKAINAVSKVISSANFILGEEVENFEKEFAAYTNTKYCVGVSTGTDALMVGLKALGIQKDDEVIVPAMTFMATASSVLFTGAKPVFVDILPNLPLMDPEKIESKITKKTKAIVPVHLHGYPCDMERITQIAKKHKLFLVEDACQAHGTLYKKQHMGSFGDAAAFSFYPSKNLGAFGDAGAIVTSNKNVVTKAHTLRNWGAKEKYIHEEIGHNARLDTIQATVLRLKLRELDKQNAKRRSHAKLYTKLLKSQPVILPQEEVDTVANYHIYAIQTSKRDKLLNYLKQKEIYGGIHYPVPLHLQPALAFLNYKKGDFPVAEKFAEQTISLPMSAQLTREQIIYVCKQIEKFFN